LSVLIAEKQTRLDVLRQMTEEGEGLEKGSQAVLKGLNDPSRIKPAIAGALVANLKVDREFIPALEAALGRAMHAVVLNDEKLAPKFSKHLRRRNQDRPRSRFPIGQKICQKTHHRIFQKEH
jgi:chromosome segregation ATPase